MASNMDTVVSYAISVGLIAFGGWIVFAAATAASGLFLIPLGGRPSSGGDLCRWLDGGEGVKSLLFEGRI
jgi:hypothetical protein